ncbi:MAG: hypothetical protein M3Q08_05225 [Pseudomonadota bacterium]|nr:hypothetical protein [Pseudomonadota bacterium]
MPWAKACIEESDGVALAANHAAARALLAESRIGGQRFRDAFGREPARFVVFSYDDNSLGMVGREAARVLGFRAVLPLPSPALVERQRAEAMRRFQAASGGGAMPHTERRAGGLRAGEPRGENQVAHELGHMWYTAAFWPAASPPTTRPTPRYGSPAPDWLDEAAAMLMENEAGARGYRQMFADGRGADPARAAAISPEMPLAELTSMTHPAMAAMPAGVAAGPTQIVTGRPSLFYAEVRVFTDYLVNRSGNPRILAAVSEGLRGGGTLDAWLAANGAKNRLPTSLAAIQADWDDWLDQRFGPAQDAP